MGSGYVVNLWNRRGDTHRAHQAIAFYDQTRQGLPRTLRIRWTLADSGFGEEAFLEHVEARNDPYVVALRLTAYVQKAIRGTEHWREVDRGWEVAEATVALSTWKTARRGVVIRQHAWTRFLNHGWAEDSYGFGLQQGFIGVWSSFPTAP